MADQAFFAKKKAREEAEKEAAAAQKKAEKEAEAAKKVLKKSKAATPKPSRSAIRRWKRAGLL